jgi:hypothetical protein
VDLTKTSGGVLQTTTTDPGGVFWFDVEGEPGDQFRLHFELSSVLPSSSANKGWALWNAGNDEEIDSDANTVSGQTYIFELPATGNVVSNQDAGAILYTRSEGSRSARSGDAEWGSQSGACTVSAGFDPSLASQLNICGQATSEDPNDIGGAGITAQKLIEYAMNNIPSAGPPNLTGNLFQVAVPEGGQPGQMLEVFWNVANITHWEYDVAAGVYRRSQNTPEHPDTYDPSTEAVTGELLGFENVIVALVPHTQLNSEGTLFDYGLGFATGPALAFRDGKVFEIQWSTVSGDYEKETGRLRPIRFEHLDGTPFPLKPGQQWVHVMHTATNITQPEPGSWRARWYAPIYSGD